MKTIHTNYVLIKNRVDVVDLVVDLVDLDLDVDLVDVDLAVSLCDGPRSVLFSFGLVAPTCFICFWPCRPFSRSREHQKQVYFRCFEPHEYARRLSFEKSYLTH